MRHTLTILGGIVAVLAIASTTTAFHATATDGCSELTVTNSVTGGDRIYGFGENSVGSFGTFHYPGGVLECRGSQTGGLEVDAAGSFTAVFLVDTDGLSPPGAPDSLALRIRYDHNLGSSVCIIHSGAQPTNGTTYTIHGTDDCTATGNPVTGTMRFWIRSEEDTFPDSNDYDCTSDDEESSGASRSCTSETGYYVVRALCNGFSVNAYPSGSTFAFGTAGNEQATVTITRTPAFQTTSGQAETITVIQPDGTTIEAGSATDWDTATTHASSFTIDQTFPAGAGSYNATSTITGTSALSGNAWTKWATAGHAATCTFDPIGPPPPLTYDRIASTGLFDANPDITFDLDGTGPGDNDVTTNFEVYNRAETVTWDTYILNARDEQLTRSMTIQVRDVDTSTLIDSHVGTGPNYADSFLIAATDPAEQTDAGEPYRFRASATDMAHFSIATFAVSSKYQVDAHTQEVATLAKDDWPTPNATEDSDYTSGDELINIWGHVNGVRLDGTDIDTTGSAVSWEVRDALGNVVDLGTGDTDSEGWTGLLGSPSAAAPTGIWEVEVCVTFNANTGCAVQPIAVVTPFTGNLQVRLAFPPHVDAGEAVQIFALVEFDSMNSTPRFAPQIRIGTVLNPSTAPVWSELVDFDSMVNVIDWTPTAAGALYVYNWTATGDVVNVWVDGDFNGTVIQEQGQIEVNNVIEIGPYNSSALIELAIWAGLGWIAMGRGWILVTISSLLGFLNPIIDDPAWPFTFQVSIVFTAIVVLLTWASFAFAPLQRMTLLTKRAQGEAQ